jgi:dihydropteroate synthase
MERPEWIARGERALPFSPFIIAGIVNITPDSFSDGGLCLDPDAAVAHALRLHREGALILDLGGESTRPGAEFVDATEEQRRLLPVLRRLQSPRPEPENSGRPGLPPPFISVDTWRASTAQAALEAGADIINDISGGTFDPALAGVLAEYRPGYILGHCPAPPRVMREHAHYGNVLEELYAYFASRLEALIKAGLPENRIALDPCPGFGKNLEQNLAILRGLRRLHSLGRPLCAAVSRKSLLGDFLGLGPGERDAATQALTALCAAQGVRIHRVHAVKGAAEALKLAGIWPEAFYA